MTQLDRRQLVLFGSSAALAVLTGTAIARQTAFEQTKIISQTAMALPNKSAPLDIDLFYDLSRYVTSRSQLDLKIAHLHHAVFSQEEWSWANAHHLYEIILKHLNAGHTSAPELMASGRLNEVDQWFASHILASWYEGTYRYEDVVKRITLEGALMWDVMGDVLPVQGLSDAEYGFWSRPPGRKTRAGDP